MSIKISNCRAGSSRSVVRTLTISSRLTTTVSSPKAIEDLTIADPSALETEPLSASRLAVVMLGAPRSWPFKWATPSDRRVSTLDRAGPADLLLQQQDAVHQRFRRRRAAG